MKKLVLSIACCLLVLGVLTGCGKTKVNDNNQSNTGNNNQTNNDTQSTRVQEFVGYSYTFDGDVIEKSLFDGLVAQTEDYSLVTYYYNDINFDTWDNITEISFERVKSILYAAFRFYPTEQNNGKIEKKTNKYDETILKVSGTMNGDQTDEGTKERQFIGAYYVNDDNHVRFTIGLVDEDYNALDKAIDLIIDNLHKV
ncbi:MAG: hypothetical protein ACLUFU_05305 [Bacilli bacterium]